MRQAFNDIASLIVAFFSGSDLVLTDIVAGLLLVAHSPHQKPPIEAIGESPSLEWMNVSKNIKEISAIYDYALSIYGWPMYLLSYCGLMPFLRLLCRLMKCRKFRYVEVF